MLTLFDERMYGEYQEEEGEVPLATPEPEIDLREELAMLSQFLQVEPYLPKTLDEEMLISFMWHSATVEEAQEKITSYFYARQAVKQVFYDRHPFSLLRYDAVRVVPLTPPTANKRIVLSTWIQHEDPDKFCPYHQAKLFFTELDILLMENQVRGKTVSIVFDMTNFSPKHCEKYTRYAATKITGLFAAFPADFNGFYLINTPSFLSAYTERLGSFDFHVVDNLEDLAGFIPRRYLTQDLGGYEGAPLRENLFEVFLRRMRRCSNWFAYEQHLRTQELKLRMTTTREQYGLTNPKAIPLLPGSARDKKKRGMKKKSKHGRKGKKGKRRKQKK